MPERSALPRLLLVGGGPPAALVLLFARLAPDLLLALAHCPLREMTGLPCPTCGGTLAVTALAAGRFAAALPANPLVVLAILGLAGIWVGALLLTAVPRWRRSLQLSGTEKRTARVLAVLAVLLNWLWLLVRA